MSPSRSDPRGSCASGITRNAVLGLDRQPLRWCHPSCAPPRVGEDEFLLTHEFFIDYAPRAPRWRPRRGRNAPPGGLIDYTHGRIRVVDRDGLEAACCLCDGVIRDGYPSEFG